MMNRLMKLDTIRGSKTTYHRVAPPPCLLQEQSPQSVPVAIADPIQNNFLTRSNFEDFEMTSCSHLPGMTAEGGKDLTTICGDAPSLLGGYSLDNNTTSSRALSMSAIDVGNEFEVDPLVEQDNILYAGGILGEIDTCIRKVINAKPLKKVTVFPETFRRSVIVKPMTFLPGP